MYPADSKSPQGKLRLLYEAAPLAFIAEQAGGKATDGVQPILDVVPRELHQRTPLVIGSMGDVEFVERVVDLVLEGCLGSIDVTGLEPVRDPAEPEDQTCRPRINSARRGRVGW